MNYINHQTIKTMKRTILIVAIALMSIFGNLWAQNSSWSLTGNSFPEGLPSFYFLGTYNNFPLDIRTNNTTRMYIGTSGNVGIGTSIPQQMLHIVGGNVLISRTSHRAPGSTNGSLLFGDTTSALYPAGEWGIEYVNNENEGYGLNFFIPWTPSHGGMNYRLFLKDNGYVGIGTNNPQANLAVNGSILAKSVRVNTGSAYWPDYVFEDNYNLMGLKELEQYVNTNRHLPGVPSAQEVGERGDVDLGTMNTLLLEKVEELTRYVIDLQNQIDELKNGKE